MKVAFFVYLTKGAFCSIIVSMMKISVDFGEILNRYGVTQAVKLVKEAGFEAVDFPMQEKKGKLFLECEKYLENAKWVRQVLNEHGLTCNQAHAGWDFHYGDKMDESGKSFRLLKRAFEFASVLGAETLVVHAVSDVPPVDFTAYNLAFYKSLEPFAKQYGVKIGIENIFNFDERYHAFYGVLSTPLAMNAFLQKLKSDVFVVCADTGHAQVTGVAPEKFIAGISAGRLQAVHLHDNDGKDDLHLLPYTGALDFDKIAAALRKAGYKGDITLEIPYFLEKFTNEELPAALKLSAQVAAALREKVGGAQ